LSQSNLCNAIGQNLTVIGQVERQQWKAVPLTRRKLSEYFGVPEAELFDDRGFAI
jgi:ribosome-binding protein aMBF1 (putative translation factor)